MDHECVQGDYYVQGIIFLCRGIINLALAYGTWVDGCCQLGLTSATHLEETLVVTGCDSVWFCGRLSLLLTTEILCNAVVVVPSLNLLWAVTD